MSKQVNFSHISVFKSQFDILYTQNIKNNNPTELESAVRKMIGLQERIEMALDRASVNVARYFKSTTQTAPNQTVEADTIKQEVREKLMEILVHNSEVNSGAKAIEHEVVPILKLKPLTPPTTLPLAAPQLPKAPDPATQFAVGFGNSGANCWANSLLSMILSMPNFRLAYETVGNYYVHNPQNPQDTVHGNALLNALVTYDLALAVKKPVEASVSQNVRLAFHHFFGYRNPLSFHELFSERSWQQEDASEAMQVLMGRYEQILQEQAPQAALPEPYCPMQTKRHYRPIGNSFPADPEKLARNDYSQLSNDNISSTVNHDYQILLDLQNKGHLSFSVLLSEYFCNTHPQGHDVGTYLLSDNNIQQFELIGEGRQFAQTPNELLLTIKRFGATVGGAGFKIASPLAVQQTLVLPAIATRDNMPIAYELDTFNVHKGDFGGGHYIAYRKIQGQWIEANDGSVRIVSEQEIDQILRGEKGPTYTSYLHHYICIDAARQQPAIAAAARPFDDAERLAQKVTACKQSIQCLEALLQTNFEMQMLEQNAPEALKALRYAIWVNDKTPDEIEYGTRVLSSNPEKLREAKLPWIISSTEKNLVEQLLMAQRHELEIASEKWKGAVLQAFLEKIKSPLSNEELLTALQALPDTLQNALHGLIYQSHLKKFGPQHVHKEEYHDEYGKAALEKGDIRKTIVEATESILNLGGKNVLEQLIFEHRTKADKLLCAYEKEQLEGFYALLTRPASEISPYQLFKAFERMELRDEIKEMLYWHLWYGHRSPQIPAYGTSTFKNDPRSLLTVRDPNIARAPVCPTGSNLLFQMIKLLEKEMR
jgi:hypothetical protein